MSVPNRAYMHASLLLTLQLKPDLVNTNTHAPIHLHTFACIHSLTIHIQSLIFIYSEQRRVCVKLKLFVLKYISSFSFFGLICCMNTDSNNILVYIHMYVTNIIFITHIQLFTNACTHTHIHIHTYILKHKNIYLPKSTSNCTLKISN